MKKINFKNILKGKIVLAVLLALVVGVGIYGTVLGLKSTIEEKKKEKQFNITTTEKFELTGKAKEFSCENFSITLTDDFEDFEDVEIDLGAVSDGIDVYVVADKFEKNSEASKMTAFEFAKSLVDPEDKSTKISEVDGIPCAEYRFVGEIDGVVKDYKVFCYKGENCFWMVHFITETQYTLKYEPYVAQWIKTVEAK